MYESILNHRNDIEQNDAPGKYGLELRNYGVLTLHRAENTDDPARLNRIIRALIKSGLRIAFPCHPRTRQRLVETGLLKAVEERFRLLEPLSYYEMLSLVKGAGVTLTDSGGLQKEAYWLGSPCITLRDNTEWVETVRAGANHLVGSDPVKIIRGIRKAMREGFSDRLTDSDLLIRGASRSILKDLISKFS
jgi:UDP-N-acetylglucosamine 2-epimerase